MLAMAKVVLIWLSSDYENLNMKSFTVYATFTFLNKTMPIGTEGEFYDNFYWGKT